MHKFEEDNRHVVLDISFYDTTRNAETKRRREELEQRIKYVNTMLDYKVLYLQLPRDEEELRIRLEQDYLAPFLAQLSDPEHLTREDAAQIKDRCLKDLKDRLVEKAQLIQEWFEREQAALQQKQAWFQQNQVSTPESFLHCTYTTQ